MDQELHFYGPFSFTEQNRSLFHSEYSKEPGIYLWVINDELHSKNYIHYVGETNSFAQRQREHFTQIIGLNYGIWDAYEAKRGNADRIWPGMWRDKTPEATQKALTAAPMLAESIREYIEAIDVYFSPIYCDKRTRKHIERSIAWNLRNNHPQESMFYPSDNRTGRYKEPIGDTLSIGSDEKIEGLDAVLHI